ncbi:MAG: HEAT repeat domain-containing protein [Planctomycetaceae bacterium]
MTIAKPQDAGALQHLAFIQDALGDPDWRKRQVAVDQLAAHRSPVVVSQLAAIIRRDHRHLSRLNAAIQVLTRTELDVVPAMLELLTDSHAEVRASAALILGEREESDAVDGLVAALGDADTNVRVYAIEALGKLRAAAAVDALIELVEDLDFDLAFPALDALAAIGDRRIAHRLIPLLQDALMQEAAIQALGMLGDEESAVCLLKWLADPGGTALKSAVAIHQIHQRYVSSYGSDNIAKLVRQSGEPAMVAALRSSLGDSTVAEKRAVIAILGMLPGAAAEDALLDLLGEPELRSAVVEALSTRNTATVGALLERFGDASRDSRLGLIEVFGRIADRSPVPLLLQCLRESDEAIATGALDALARIGDAQVYPFALECLGHSSVRVRQAAVAAINALGHPSTAADVQRLLSDSSTSVCESAVKIAGYFGFAECVDALLACCDHPQERIRRAAVEHLICLDDPRTAARLERALRSDTAPVRAAAAGAFGELDADVAIPRLVEALDDSDVWVRYFAVRSLAKVDHSATHREKLLTLAREDSAMQVRIAAMEALPASAVAELSEFSNRTDDDLATAALKALGAIRQAVALPALIEAAASDNLRRRAEAIRALGESGLPEAGFALSEIALRRNEPLWEEATAALAHVRSDQSIAALLAIAGRPSRRSAAKTSLNRLGEHAVPALSWHLHHSPLETRLVVVDVLIGTATAVQALEAALEDEAPAVRHRTLSGLAYVRSSGAENSQGLCREGRA